MKCNGSCDVTRAATGHAPQILGQYDAKVISSKAPGAAECIVLIHKSLVPYPVAGRELRDM